MDRKIKFRVWDKKTETMENVEILLISEGYAYTKDRNYIHNSQDWDLIDLDNSALMQLTGLKDKNGVEIYEGDIIIHNDNNYVIRYSDNLGMVALATTKEYATFEGIVKRNHRYRNQEWLWNVQKYLTVIGNIFENPELIK